MMTEYKVLARKYRPQNFDDLVGQDVLVQTLRNAIDSNRIAHAFLLTGIRGIGKTTTARIIAKALNCLGEDGNAQQPTIAPCGVCSNCEQIRDDRHVDVLEMDAASRTGVGDVREIIDSIYYKPSAARYKVYIIDEAHMLSNNAFNALLKTLEEPPAHVIFIFATTEIRKIPVTILSRCQRFDLQRLNTQALTTHLGNIASKESVRASDEALELISIAAEGSVRDALSLMDQAIAHAQHDNKVEITPLIVRELLGLVDRTRLYTMLNHLFAGQCKEALELLESHHQEGAHMPTLLHDMMQAVHLISRLLVDKKYSLNSSFSDHEKTMLHQLADRLNIPSATKAWQILTSSTNEIKQASNALAAMEMLFIRFSYSANMPDPTDLLKILQQSGSTSSPHPTATQPSVAPSQDTLLQSSHVSMDHHTHTSQTQHLSLVAHNTDIAQPLAKHITTYDDVITLCKEAREMLLMHPLKNVMRFVSCDNHTLIFSNESRLETKHEHALKKLLEQHTYEQWQIKYIDATGELTVAEKEKNNMNASIEQAKKTPIVASILEHFDDARIVRIEQV